VSGLVDLMVERAAAARGQHPDQPVARHGPAVGSVAAGWYECQTECCLNLREPGRPALCQVAG
jgi:ferrochelatase